ncbi:Site-specific recombinase XerD [Faunimonas pinastri]|uniref:Site-specific recombinase XerD n=1 Tax=Faunimonas pinastri TaxID=1855383 RepID=A0A1H9NZB7_9HYPH|nr:tyrosine-type recombinase/integrase [Faunimonas pinastri]SER41282.1 Site-specific recombinase XerD [Faunimonas pinastri]
MLFRLVRPVKRQGSSNHYFVQRIPADLKGRVAGLPLEFPLGAETHRLTISPSAVAVRFSLRTRDPGEVKERQAACATYLERVWTALRADQPAPLTHRQATALAGDLYRAWANPDELRSTAVELSPSGEWVVVTETHEEHEAAITATLEHWRNVGQGTDLETALGSLVDRLLRRKGIQRVDDPSRKMVLDAFHMALQHAWEALQRNAQGDYSPDPKATRFPEWQETDVAPPAPFLVPVAESLKALVDGWWKEAKATGLAVSTYESYRNTMERFVTFLRHDDAARVTEQDVVRFKDFRLSETNRRTGKLISPKTVKDSDLAGLKSVFTWAVANLRMQENPARRVTLKVGKQVRSRSKGFTEAEARAVLTHALHHQQARENPKTQAAKRWTPWLCAYTGARVGEILQLRKHDVRREGDFYFITITPEAGTVKTKEVREVPLHPHLVELGFIRFVKGSSDGNLFLNFPAHGDIRKPLRGLRNRMAAFVREVVPDEAVAPNHAWRHLFKTRGFEAGIQERVLDAICGHAPRTVGAAYGEVTLRTMWASIQTFPRFSS